MDFTKNRLPGTVVTVRKNVVALYKFRYVQEKGSWEIHRNNPTTTTFPLKVGMQGTVVAEELRGSFLLCDTTITEKSRLVTVFFQGRERPILVNALTLEPVSKKGGKSRRE